MFRKLKTKLIICFCVGVIFLLSNYILSTGIDVHPAEIFHAMKSFRPLNENTLTSDDKLPRWKTNFSEPIIYNEIFQDEHNQYVIYERLLQQNIRQYWNDKGNVYRLLDMKPIEFDQAFKNPCWVGHQGNGPMEDNKIHCLPYFYILGMDRAATVDIYSRLCKHPLVQSPGYTELQWFPRLRFGRASGGLMSNKHIQGLIRKGPDAQSINFYISMFDPIASYIDSLQPKIKKGNGTKHLVITGDATLSTLLENPRWHLWHGNEGLSEPRYTNLHFIKQFTPNAKIIILFRDPIDRLFSEFCSMTEGNSYLPELFHSQVVLAVDVYKECFQKHSTRRCAYNETIKETLKKRGVQFAESFHGGFYPFVIREVYSVFDKENVLPLVMFDRDYNRESTMKIVLAFLSLGNPSKEIMKEILKDEAIKKTKKTGIMLNETKLVLHDFFKPFNTEMAKMMNSDRYLFYS